eukprot:CCRYP_005967-RA/>CCRYP_005967-RA protein AED:0.01 eAED:0.01 QI:212/1/1/1/0/0.5/2/721/130
MLSYLNAATSSLWQILLYLHGNAWTIVLIATGGYFCWAQFISPLLHRYQIRQSYLFATDPNRVAVLSPDMKRVRAEQQRIANAEAMKAEAEKKARLQAEKERKRVKSPEEERWEKLGGSGNKLGGLKKTT